MIRLLRTTAKHPDFIELVRLLDAYLTVTDGDEHDFYDQYNQLDDIKYVVLVYQDQTPVGCGAIKAFTKQAMEIKRMYVAESVRGQGIAGQILVELENWARSLGADRCILETGLRQTAAVRLYEKSNYQRIPNYGQYVGVNNSVCMEKWL